MHYDIAIKRLMELGGKEILREFANVELAFLDILEETGQETYRLGPRDVLNVSTVCGGRRPPPHRRPHPTLLEGAARLEPSSP